MEMWLSNLRTRGLAVRAAVLVSATIGVYLLVVPLAWHFAGPRGLASATVAGFSCLAGSALALIVGEPFRRARRVLQAVLLGMALRMGAPLVAAVVVYLHGDGLVQAGFFWYLVVFFEITLLVEVFLSLPPKEHGEE